MNNIKDKLGLAKARLGAFAKSTPLLIQGFGAISKQATQPGSFSPAQKELVAVAIAVSKGCEDCILYHVEAAKQHGAEEAQLVEMLEVTVEMGGGPAIMYSAKALEIFREL
ncbi:hypothetical protein Brsp07_03834 [Brucella sp. NBRC 14130]|uniref:carboxymuconolactone decarboxylase family protein n=1 Tax=Brucella TaxID=234 RepID=UPI000AA063A1|nr:carboxymuconolactone decarboxylase family protein [Brucella intermedia]KAB2722561.1 carboxymuconolactone decarboxylase family protein [Brucella intermedia]